MDQKSKKYEDVKKRLDRLEKDVALGQVAKIGLQKLKAERSILEKNYEKQYQCCRIMCPQEFASGGHIILLHNCHYCKNGKEVYHNNCSIKS